MDNHKHAAAAFKAVEDARRKFGQSRLELGIYLEHIRQSEVWKLRNESFSQFLEEERINDTAAYQYMRVARRFIIELAVEEVDLNELVMVNFSTLDLAARVVTHENLHEVLAVVTSLSERDAKAELELFAHAGEENHRRKKREAPVAKVLRLFRQLPDDQRIDVKNVLRLPNEAGREQPAS